MFASFFANFAAWFVLASGPLVDRIAGGSLLAFFCLGYMEFFSMVARGFSLSIIRAIDSHENVNFRRTLELYADGRGIGWLFQKRIDGLKMVGFIAATPTEIQLVSEVGARFGQFCNLFKQTFKMGKGG
jgi:hypothetical protein